MLLSITLCQGKSSQDVLIDSSVQAHASHLWISPRMNSSHVYPFTVASSLNPSETLWISIHTDDRYSKLSGESMFMSKVHSNNQCSFSWAVTVSHSAEQRGGRVLLLSEWPAVKNEIFCGFTEVKVREYWVGAFNFCSWDWKSCKLGFFSFFR